MWITLLIFCGLFVAMVASLYLEYEDRERQREQEAMAVLASAPPARPDRCMLCDAPLRRARTTDEVVLEVEHRIDAELQAITHLLRTSPEKASRVYLA